VSGFIQGEGRFQATFFPERLDDYVAEDSTVHVIDVFLGDLDLSGLGFKTQPNDTGRPAYHPSTMLKLFVYGYLNLFASAFVAIDGSKFKAVNSRDRNFTRAKMKRRLAEADQAEPAEDKTRRLANMSKQATVIPLTTGITLSAADFAMQYKLSFTDAIIYAKVLSHIPSTQKHAV
jgi:hypothetical protein